VAKQRAALRRMSASHMDGWQARSCGASAMGKHMGALVVCVNQSRAFNKIYYLLAL